MFFAQVHVKYLFQPHPQAMALLAGGGNMIRIRGEMMFRRIACQPGLDHGRVRAGKPGQFIRIDLVVGKKAGCLPQYFATRRFFSFMLATLRTAP